MAIAPDTEWEVFCTSSEFDQVRNNEKFQRIVTLARIVNSIRFIQIAVTGQKGNDTPSAVRQRIASLFYLAGVLYEGLKFADRLGEIFHQSDAFQKGVAQVLTDKRVKKLRAGELELLRNEAVYHHDDHVIAKAIGTMSANEYVFVSAAGKKRGDIYYDLADLAVLQYALGMPESTKAFETAAADLLGRITDVAIRFANASDTLIAITIREFGWRRRSLRT
jgi:hypothetical protein